MSRTPAGKRGLGPYSRVLRRGAIRDGVDGRTTVGRFIRDLERQLIAHIGGNPNIMQKLLIDRLIRIRLQLDILDEKLSSGWTDHDSRTYGGLLNAFRLTCREIGVDAAPEPEKSWWEQVQEAREAAQNASRTAVDEATAMDEAEAA